MRATGSHEVILKNVPIPGQNAVDIWPASAPPAADAERFPVSSPIDRPRC